MLDGIVDDIVNDPDNFDDESYEQVYGGDYYSPPEYDLKSDATINHFIFDAGENGLFNVDDMKMYCIGFNLSDNIYNVFRKLYYGNISDGEIYDSIADICKDDTIDVDNEQQHSTIVHFLKHQQTLPLMQPGISQDDIRDLFEMKTPTFNQFYKIVCENTDQSKLDAIQNVLEQYPNILTQTKKYISHCIYELQNESVPLYYSIIKQLKLIPTLDKDRMSVDACGNLWYNPIYVQNDLIENGDDSKLKSILIHEVMHIINRTSSRMIAAHQNIYDKAYAPGAKNEDIGAWNVMQEISNIAYDLIINRDITKEGYKLPDDVYNVEVDENGHYIWTFDFTTDDDDQPDIKHIDISKFTCEKSYSMFVGACKYVIDKLYKQGKLTQDKYDRYTNILAKIQ